MHQICEKKRIMYQKEMTAHPRMHNDFDESYYCLKKKQASIYLKTVASLGIEP